MKCTLCPRNCGADREKEVGFCGAGAEAVLARAELHFWEEPYLAGGGASGAVFFSGCNLKCAFCQNYKISFSVSGERMSAAKLADVFRRLEDEGAENIDLITPTPFIDSIKGALDLFRPSIPVIYNSGGYERKETIASLKGYIDVYLPDYKYFDDSLAVRYSRAPNYRKYCEEAMLEMRSQVADEVENGVLKKGLAIRHLVLPTHVRDSISVIDRIFELFGKNVFLSIMSQYIPCGALTDFPELDRSLTSLEYKTVIAHAEKLGFENAFMQEMSAAKKDYIPAFLR